MNIWYRVSHQTLVIKWHLVIETENWFCESEQQTWQTSVLVFFSPFLCTIDTANKCIKRKKSFYQMYLSKKRITFNSIVCLILDLPLWHNKDKKNDLQYCVLNNVGICCVNYNENIIKVTTSLEFSFNRFFFIENWDSTWNSIFMAMFFSYFFLCLFEPF